MSRADKPISAAEKLLVIIRIRRRLPVALKHQTVPASFPLKELYRLGQMLNITNSDYLEAMHSLIRTGVLVLSGQASFNKHGESRRRQVIIPDELLPDWFGLDANCYFITPDGAQFDHLEWAKKLRAATISTEQDQIRKRIEFTHVHNLRVTIFKDGLPETIRRAYDRGDGPDGLNHELRALRQNHSSS